MALVLKHQQMGTRQGSSYVYSGDFRWLNPDCHHCRVGRTMEPATQLYVPDLL
jgi:hypothetical protein